MRRRLQHAIDWRMRALTSRSDALSGQVRALAEQVDAVSRQVDAMQRTLDDRVSPVLQAIVSEDADNRRRLAGMRAQPGYERAWDDSAPLVSVTVPTRDRLPLLLERALPSVFAQTHAQLEVIVVGDAAAPEVEEAVRAIGDPRVRWANLTQRIEAHPDPRRHHLVASGMARNEAARLARGQWLLHFDDDDALRPDAIETLLALARETRAEAVYGCFDAHLPGGAVRREGSWPPAIGAMGWQGALHHAALPFERELVAAHLGVPGDGWLLERMLRAGVRFAFTEQCVWDYHPSWGRSSGTDGG